MTKRQLRASRGVRKVPPGMKVDERAKKLVPADAPRVRDLKKLQKVKEKASKGGTGHQAKPSLD